MLGITLDEMYLLSTSETKRQLRQARDITRAITSDEDTLTWCAFTALCTVPALLPQALVWQARLSMMANVLEPNETFTFPQDFRAWVLSSAHASVRDLAECKFGDR